MRDSQKYIDDVIESKLRTSKQEKVSGDFTMHLMQRITTENKALVEERKSERIVKYAIGSFSMFVIAFTVVLGIVSTTGKQTAGDTTGVGFNTVETSTSLVDKLLYYVQSFFVSALNFFGLSLDSGSINIILIVALVIGVFVAGERLFLRGKLKSNVQLK